MRHPVRGFLIGPLIVPMAYWLGGTAWAWAWQDARINVLHALRELMVIVTFGLPIAYVAALALGAPVLYLLHRVGWLRAWTVIAAGALAGTIVAEWFAFNQQGSLFVVRMSVPAGAALGALAGAATWWAGRAARQGACDAQP